MPVQSINQSIDQVIYTAPLVVYLRINIQNSNNNHDTIHHGVAYKTNCNFMSIAHSEIAQTGRLQFLFGVNLTIIVKLTPNKNY